MKRAIIPLALSLIGCLVTAAVNWPERRYVSVATLREAPNPTSPDAGESTNERSLRLTARISELAQAVLSRDSLAAMIRKLDLYPEESHTLPMEDLIERCRNTEIHISNLKEGGAFDISVSHKDPRLAQAATQYLTSRFLETNIRLGEADAKVVMAFLDRLAEAAE